MASYFHTRAIFLRVESERTRGKQVCVRVRVCGKDRLLLSGARREPARCLRSRLAASVWVTSHLRWIAMRVVTNTSRQINTDPFYFYSSPLPMKIGF